MGRWNRGWTLFSSHRWRRIKRPCPLSLLNMQHVDSAESSWPWALRCHSVVTSSNTEGGDLLHTSGSFVPTCEMCWQGWGLGHASKEFICATCCSTRTRGERFSICRQEIEVTVDNQREREGTMVIHYTEVLSPGLFKMAFIQISAGCVVL